MAHVLLGAMAACSVLLFAYLAWRWVGLFDGNYVTPPERASRRYRVMPTDDEGEDRPVEHFACLTDACTRAESVKWPLWATPVVIDELTDEDVFGQSCPCPRCQKEARDDE